jgi:hypothetical protein
MRATVCRLFEVRRDRAVVLGLVGLAAVVSTTELVATQLFSALILPKGDRSSSHTVVLVLLFFAVFGGLRLVNFAREMYRINVFERALTSSVGAAHHRDSWRWAMAIEVTSLLSSVARVVVVALALVALAPAFGIAVLVVMALVGKALSVIFVRQLSTQRGFRAMQLAQSPASNATKIRNRVKAGEVGSLIAHLGVVLLVGALIMLTLDGRVAPGTSFVLFVALRMMGQMLGEISKGLTRFVRARANSE